MGATAPFWRFSAASYPDLKEQAPVNVLRGSKTGAIVPPSETTAGVCASFLRLLNFGLKFFIFLFEIRVA